MEQNKATTRSFDFNVEGICYSDSEKLALTGSNLTSAVWNGSVVVYKDAEEFEVINTDVSSSTVCWCGTFVITGHDDGSVKAWPTADTKGVTSTTTFREHNDIVSSVAYKSHCEFATASWDTKIKVYDLAGDRASKSTLQGHYMPINSIDIDPTGSLLLSSSKDNNVLLWDFRESTPKNTISSTTPPISAVFSTLDSHQIAVSGESGSLNIYDLRATNQQVYNIKTGHKDAINVVRFSRAVKGVIATGGDDGKVIVHDLANGKVLYNYQHGDYVRGLSWGASGVLASSSWDKTVAFHRLK